MFYPYPITSSIASTLFDAHTTAIDTAAAMPAITKRFLFAFVMLFFPLILKIVNVLN
jgi:hypothetical protein